MPFDSGTFTLTNFKLPKPLPSNQLELFSQRKAGKLDDVRDEQAIGWVSGRHLLETKIDEETSICGGHLHLSMRIAERKIPPALLNAICKREQLVYMQANNVAGVPSKVKKEIKVEAMEKHLMKMPPQLSSVPMVLDRQANMLYVGTGSNAQIDNFVSFFIQTTEVEPYHINAEYISETLCKTSLMDLPNVNFVGGVDQDGITPERDFLTWLWYFSEQEGGKINVPDYGDFEMMIDGPLTFAFGAEAKGAAETTVKKGNPMRSAEVKAALAVGKKLKKAKVVIVQEQNIWTSNFDADKFSFGGVALPDGQEMEYHSKFEERVTFLHIFNLAFQHYFKRFVETLKAPNWLETEKKIFKWASERDSL